MKLILVYNADDGLFNAITDTIHKVMSPSTYECRLCQFTYGMTGMLQKWRHFLADLKTEKVFLHRNEFRKLYPETTADLPAIFRENKGEISPLLTADEINACNDLDSLILEVELRLAETTPSTELRSGTIE